MYDPTTVTMNSTAGTVPSVSSSSPPPPPLGAMAGTTTGVTAAPSSSMATGITTATSASSTLQALKATTTATSTSPDANVAAPGSKMVTSEDLLLSVPTPVVRLLIILSRPIAITRRAIEIVLWRSKSPVESWLVVGLWWALCLGGRAAWRYFLPPLCLLPFIPLPSTPSLRPPSIHLQPPLIHSTTKSQPATTQTLLLTLSHLYAINGMMPSELWAPAGRGLLEWLTQWEEMERKRLLRGGCIIWLGWVVLNMLLGVRTTLALMGTLVLLWPSPPLRSTHQLLRKSLFLRRLAALAFLLVFGSPPAAPGVSPSTGGSTPFSTLGSDSQAFSLRYWLKKKWSTSRRPSFAFRLRPYGKEITSSALSGSAVAEEDEAGVDGKAHSGEDDPSADKSTKPSPPIYFRFELHENQRWWMGLDWTSALLPQERPSWCDMYLNPASPPSSFALPSETVIYLPEPRKNDPNGRVKRTAKWRWIDEDWSVVRKTGGVAAGGTKEGAADPSGGSNDVGMGAGGHGRKPSTSAGSGGADGDSHGDAGNGHKPKGLAEQAFVKGLEKLKQRTMATQQPQQPSPSSPSKNRPLSGDFSDGAGASGVGGTDDKSSLASRRLSQQNEGRRRTSSQSSDLQSLLGAFGHGANQVSVGTGGSALLQQNATGILHDLDVGTDADGWSYGDNKWEGMGPKGGMGRYTRRRRWQRRAVCIETVEYLPGTPAPAPAPVSENSTTAIGRPVIKPKSRADSHSSHQSSIPPILEDVISAAPVAQVEGYTVTASTPTKVKPAAPGSSPVAPLEGVAGNKARTGSTASVSDRDQVLRQRLRNAMGSVGA